MGILQQTFGNTALLALAFAGTATVLPAQQGGGLFGGEGASVTFGPYARLELGGAFLSFDNGKWEPPGAADPTIDFDVDGDNVGFGALAIGYDWQNGFRSDIAFFATGTSDLDGPCERASDGTPCSVHADISDASVRTTGVMANLFYAPLEARGSESRFQPFVVAGLGAARNEMGDWTRENQLSGRPFREFEGDTTTNVAWSIGVGASYQVTRTGDWPVLLEASWRYYDFGEAKGSEQPLPGNGSSTPREPFGFDLTEQVVTFGVRIPLQRF